MKATIDLAEFMSYKALEEEIPVVEKHESPKYTYIPYPQPEDNYYHNLWLKKSSKFDETNPYNSHRILSRKSKDGGKMAHYLANSLSDQNGTKFKMTGTLVIDYNMLSKKEDKFLKFYPSDEDIAIIKHVINRFECENVHREEGEFSDPFIEDPLRKKKYIRIGQSSINSFNAGGQTVRLMEDILNLHLMIEYSKVKRYQPTVVTVVFEMLFFRPYIGRDNYYSVCMDNADLNIE